MELDSLSPEGARMELERLQDELASRRSTVHFAHSGVSMVVAIIFGGASGKLFWDAYHAIPYWAGAAAGVIAIAALSYSVLRYRVGMRVLGVELSRFETFRALRRRLGLDDPSALLPQ